MPNEKVELSEELAIFFNRTLSTLDQNRQMLSSKFSDTDRKIILDGLGQAGSAYRATIYENGFTGLKREITRDKLLHFSKTILKYLEHSIDANKRKDDLYHSYNLMTVSNKNEIAITYLNEMLEGQVAVLSSGHLTLEACLKLLDSLKAVSYTHLTLPTTPYV